MEERNHIRIFKYFSNLQYEYPLLIFNVLLCFSEIIILFSLDNYLNQIVSVCGYTFSVLLCIFIPLLMQIIMYSVMRLAYRKAYETYIYLWYAVEMDEESTYLAEIGEYVKEPVCKKYSLFEISSIIIIILSAIINKLFLSSYRSPDNGSYLYNFFIENKIVLCIILLIVLAYFAFLLVCIFIYFRRSDAAYERFSQIGFGEEQNFSGEELLND